MTFALFQTGQFTAGLIPVNSAISAIGSGFVHSAIAPMGDMPLKVNGTDTYAVVHAPRVIFELPPVADIGPRLWQWTKSTDEREHSKWLRKIKSEIRRAETDPIEVTKLYSELKTAYVNVRDWADNSLMQRVFQEAFGHIPSLAELQNSLHAPHGYRVYVQTVTHSLPLDSSEHEIGIAMQIETMGGKIVGRLIRSFYKDKLGAKVNYIDEIWVDETVQRNGIATEVMRSAIQYAILLNVKRMDICATWDGLYWWAKRGFNWGPQDVLKRGMAFVKYMIEQGIPQDIAVQIADKTAHAAWLVAEAWYKGRQIGKDYLLDHLIVDNWNGYLRLDDENDPGFQQAKKMLRL